MTYNPPKNSAQHNAFFDAACVDLGFCLPPSVREDLVKNASGDCAAFVASVIKAEGLDPEISGHFKKLLALYHLHVTDSE